MYFVTGPQFDNSGSYRATSESLKSNAVQRWVDPNSYSTQHYAFLTGSGAKGIAFWETACLRGRDGVLV